MLHAAKVTNISEYPSVSSKITFLPEYALKFLRRVRITPNTAVVTAEGDADKAFLMADADQADDSLVVTWGDLNEIVHPFPERKAAQPFRVHPPPCSDHIGVPVPERILLLLGIQDISPKILH